MRKDYSKRKNVVKRVNGLLVAALVIFSGCDKSDVADGPVAASFTAGIDGRLSRAADTRFTVGDLVGISGTSGAVAYTNVEFKATGDEALELVDAKNVIYYNDAADVTFTAYYPYAGAVGTAPGVLTVGTDGAKQAAGEQPKIDFLHATAVGNKNVKGGQVEFAFTHRMSQIVLSIKVTDGLESLEKVAGYEIAGLKLQGTFNTATGEAVADAAAVAEKLNVALTAGAVKTVDSRLIVLPQEVGTTTFTMELTDGAGDKQVYTGTMTIPDGKLQAGTSYSFNVNVSKTGLTVSKATIGSWVDKAGGDVTAK